MSLMTRNAMKDLLTVASSLGGNYEENHQRLQKSLQAVVSEIYSPPRVTAAAARLTGLRIDPGAALDLTTVDEFGRPWDFSKDEMQQKAMKKFKEEQPTLIVGSPMCTAHSPW